MTEAQIQLMIESLEELNEELSNQCKGSLFTEQWDLLEYLQQEKAKWQTKNKEKN